MPHTLDLSSDCGARPEIRAEKAGRIALRAGRSHAAAGGPVSRFARSLGLLARAIRALLVCLALAAALPATTASVGAETSAFIEGLERPSAMGRSAEAVTFAAPRAHDQLTALRDQDSADP